MLPSFSSFDVADRFSVYVVLRRDDRVLSRVFPDGARFHGQHSFGARRSYIVSNLAMTA
jgi:hypothetical protein